MGHLRPVMSQSASLWLKRLRVEIHERFLDSAVEAFDVGVHFGGFGVTVQ